MGKKLNITGLIFFILAILFWFIDIFLLNDEFGIGILIIGIPLLGIAIIFWFLSFVFYLASKKPKIAKMTAIILLIFFSVVLISSILGLMSIGPFEYWDIAGWFVWPLQVIIVVSLIIVTIKLNKMGVRK
ncbi:hypothetical protein KA107_03735 [Candidatus Pacearchaeota archaeon]|nr:hypothetical protein [Candidatus Pacearchaeota archaeon]